MSQGHVGVLYPRTYLSWCATARLVGNLGKELSDESFMGMPGIVFGDGGYIEIKIYFDNEVKKSVFYCQTGQEEIESDELAKVMDFLWYTHSMNEWPNV